MRAVSIGMLFHCSQRDRGGSRYPDAAPACGSIIAFPWWKENAVEREKRFPAIPSLFRGKGREGLHPVKEYRIRRQEVPVQNGTKLPKESKKNTLI